MRELDIERARQSRRRLLQRFGALAAASLLPWRDGLAQPVFADDPFRLGVAAGDPAADGFVIWTRLAPRPLEPEGGMPRQAVELEWEVARDERFLDIAASGKAIAHPLLGHSVHVELSGLQPARSYWYRFRAGRERSISGHARTLPAPGSRPERLRFAVAGCQHYEQGLYTAYRHLSREELDFVFCYGDYIYEYRGRDFNVDPASGELLPTVRRSQGQELMTLDDYRRRYAEAKMDLDLMQAHARHAWFCSWDDHETVNNWAGEYAPDGSPPELFALRRAAAAQAFYEMMPLRKASFPQGGRLQLYRRARCGELLDLHVLDTRSWRSDQACGDRWDNYPCDGVRDPKATMLGAAQERWLFDGLASSTTRWQGMAQQIMLADFQRDATRERINLDAWIGYQLPRERLLDHVQQRRLGNVVVLTGDEHQHHALDIKRQGGSSSEAPLMTEFVATSISSGGDGSPVGRGGEALLRRNPHCHFYNQQRGYLVCDVDATRWQTEFRVLDQVRRPGGLLSTPARFVVEPGRPGVQKG